MAAGSLLERHRRRRVLVCASWVVQTFLAPAEDGRPRDVVSRIDPPGADLGVPFEALALNVMINFAAGLELSAPTIWRSPVLFWAAAIPIHIGLRRLTSWDYHWFRTVRLWALTAAPGAEAESCPPSRRGRAARRPQVAKRSEALLGDRIRSRITSPTMSC